MRKKLRSVATVVEDGAAGLVEERKIEKRAAEARLVEVEAEKAALEKRVRDVTESLKVADRQVERMREELRVVREISEVGKGRIWELERKVEELQTAGGEKRVEDLDDVLELTVSEGDVTSMAGAEAGGTTEDGETSGGSGTAKRMREQDGGEESGEDRCKRI